ncbi:MAG: PIN domain-containing protein [Candidatus Thiothrix moscowensis]|nr:PIN domain-containing protein [Candidatus Thiothrix moscowensis]
MTAKTFVDSNILLYVYDHAAGWKQEICKQVVQDLWRQRCGVISTQVMQEFYNNATRKLRKPMTYETARAELKLYEAWEVVQVDPSLIQIASNIQETAQLSFWDSLIVAAAQRANASVLLSEDLNHGQVIGGVRIHNPLLNQVQEEGGRYLHD